MSRIGKLPVPVPEKVEATVEDNTVTIKGPKGELCKSFDKSVEIALNDGVITVRPTANNRQAAAMYGTARSIINGMVHGVVEGFSRDLEIMGVGFRASVSGDTVDLALGFSHPIRYKVPKGVTVTVAENTKVKVTGADKHLVGQVAADIRSFKPVEPYKGKGITLVGVPVRRKEGKKTA